MRSLSKSSHPEIEAAPASGWRANWTPNCPLSVGAKPMT
jgi:hypothetical protein